MQTIAEYLAAIIPHGDKCHGCPKGQPRNLAGYSGDVFCDLMEEVMPLGEKNCGFNLPQPRPKVITTCCPKCSQEQFVMTIVASGSGDSEFGTVHWFEGEGACPACGYVGWHSDQSI